MTNVCEHVGVSNVISGGIKRIGRPFGFPFHTSERPSDENIRKYRLRKCSDCGGWFPWFGGW